MTLGGQTCFVYAARAIRPMKRIKNPIIQSNRDKVLFMFWRICENMIHCPFFAYAARVSPILILYFNSLKHLYFSLPCRLPETVLE